MATFNPFAIEGFKYRLYQGGVRPSYFTVSINSHLNYAGAANEDLLPFSSRLFYLCRAAELPGLDVDNIKLHYQTREINIPGSKKYKPIRLRFINDTEFTVRKKMETWMQRINLSDENVRVHATENLLGSITVTQYSAEAKWGLGLSAAGSLLDAVGGFTAADAVGLAKNFLPPKKLREYQFTGAYPRSITAIELNQDSGDQFEEFDVEFEYQYWKTNDVGTVTTSEEFFLPKK